jgi:hypothetical protein
MRLKLITILFVVSIIVLVYILFHILYSKTALVKQQYLGTGLIPIPMTKIPNYTSNSYFYEIWIYTNSVDKASSAITNAAATNPGGNIFYVDNSISLDLYKNTELYVNVNNAQNTYDQYMVTKEFPLQKWQHIIIHVQNYLMDLYLNGKLVKSNQLTSANKVKIPATGASIYFGKSDTYIAKFNRLTSILNTNIAWQKYLEGNSNLVPIHARLSLTADPEKTVSSYNLF